MSVKPKDTLEELYGAQYETTLVYLLLTDNNFAGQMYNGIDASLFQNPAYREIVATFRTVCDTNGGAVPTWRSVEAYLVERKTKLDGKNANRAKAVTDALAKLTELKRRKPPSLSDASFIRDNLERFITHRNVHSALLNAVDLMEEGDFDSIQALVEEAVQSGRLKVVADPGLELTDVDGLVAAIKHRNSTMLRCPLALKNLDQFMRGGLEPERLGVFMASPGTGKTMFMVNAGVQALLKGVDVVHITLEIDKYETNVRYASRITGIPINEILMNIDRYPARLKQSFQRIQARLFTRQWGSMEANVNDIRAYLKYLEMNHNLKPGLILVDYADLLVPTRNQKEKRTEIADVYRQLRQLAYDKKCALWTASQVTKEGYDHEVLSLSSIYESGEKAAVSDVILGLCQTPAERRKSQMRIVVLKNRQGGNEGKIIDIVTNVATQTITQAQVQRADMLNGGRPITNPNGRGQQHAPAQNQQPQRRFVGRPRP